MPSIQIYLTDKEYAIALQEAWKKDITVSKLLAEKIKLQGGEANDRTV